MLARSDAPKVPSWITEPITFWTLADLWMYFGVPDDRMCDECLKYQSMNIVTGDFILNWMPYVEIVDWNFMWAHVHPHCRCYMVRVS